MRVALGQIDVKWKQEEENKNKCEEFIKRAVENKADLVVFPEMTLTGVSNNIVYLTKVSEDSVKFFKDMTSKYNINICFGYAKPYEDRCKNNLVVLSSEGKELAEYTKIHPFSFASEDKYFEPGCELQFFKLKDTTLATFICYDLRFPEIFQAASKKASALIVIANWPKPRREHWISLLKARAIENQCYVIAVNRVGDVKGLIYSGDSMVIDPLGNVIKESFEKEELIICDIEPEKVEKVREKFPLKNDRKEEFYAKLFTE
ncbi:carbon-nitrogen family hydrolase [Clostridium brassicae]|uniref:Carbon-nitrogen family hydrolase n=1 Tax=Clostridium brassicae TaxID=2999072 RepID=A0ABT4DDV1_9CLOT|nr:carbon-nitrogen family hydrolase [Clostridium brassicae]MCY6960491.1 carbon-nitrogen family hydrolase [Clostridium brassicae]